MMISIFSERYYGQTPDSTAFVRHPSDRTPPVVRYDHPSQAPTPRPHHSSGPSGALRRRDGGHRFAQPRYRRARAPALSPRGARGPSAPHGARAGAYRDPRVESRTPAGDRPRPAYGRGPQCQLDAPLVGYVSGGQDPGGGHRRDGALVSACRWRCLQTADLDAQTQSRSTTGLRGKRLRVEVIWAGAGTPTPPPVPALVDADLLEEVPPALEALLSLLPRADLYLQDEVQFTLHPTLTRVGCWKGRRGPRRGGGPRGHDKSHCFRPGGLCGG